MKSNGAFKLKLTIAAVLAAALIYMAMKYQEASAKQDDSGLIEAQWQKLKKLPVPKGAVPLFGKVDGGVNPYGIDAHHSMLFELGEEDAKNDDGKCRTNIANLYGTFLREWHPGLWDVGRSGELFTVTGKSGMATIRVNIFWFHQVLTKQYNTPLVAHIQKKYQPEEGLARRFAEVHVVVCTRGAGEQ